MDPTLTYFAYYNLTKKKSGREKSSIRLLSPPVFVVNFEVKGCPSKENLFVQSTLLMNAMYTVFPSGDM